MPIGRFCLSVAILVFTPTQASFPARSAPALVPVDSKAQLLQAKQLRDAFIRSVHGVRLSCSITEPAVELFNKPSFGQYEDHANLVRTSDWSTLTVAEKAFFRDLAGSDKLAYSTFDTYVHRWTFMHEMAHWWQACHQHPAQTLYEIEIGANRVALAYWQQTDPRVVLSMRAYFQAILAHMPAPVLAGQPVADYFNKNDEPLALSSTLEYQWFQAAMFRAIDSNGPAPALQQTLR